MARLMPRGVRAMLLLLILTILVPLLLVQAGIYLSWFQTRRHAELNANLEFGRAVASNFDSYVRDILSQELAIGLAFTTPGLSPAGLDRLLVESRNQYPSLEAFSLVSPDGQIISSSSPESIGTEVRNRPYFKELLGGKDWVMSDLFIGDTAGRPALVLARVSKDSTGVLRGVVVASIDPSRLDPTLGVRRGGGASISLVDRQGWLVYRYPETPANWEGRNWVRRDPTYGRALGGEEVASVVSLPGEPERLAARVPIPSLGWAAGASRPVEAAMAPILLDLATYSLLSILVSAMAVGMAILVSRRLTRPLDRLRRHALSVGQGEAVGRTQPVEGPMELAELSAAFNKMVEELRAREEGQFKRASAMALLAEASDLFSASLDRETTLSSVVELAVPRLADWCIVDLFQDGNLPRKVIAVHADPALREAVGRLLRLLPSLDGAGNSASRVIRSGKGELIARVPDVISEEVLRRTGLGEIFAALTPESMMIVPMVVRGRTIGVLLLASGKPSRRYDSDDLAFVELLARRAALALDNARLYSEVQEAVQLRDEFLSVAAHELKTPITSLRGFAQLTLRGWEKSRGVDESRLKQAFEVIDQQSGKLSQLVSQLLDVSRMQAGRLALNSVDADLVPIVKSVLASVGASAGHVQVYQGPPSLTARVDPLRFEQVITNLVDNAVKFSPHGGDLLATLESLESGDVRLSVRDHGIGVPAQRRDHIFDRFYQAHAEGYYGGMGLGLYISREIVILHGGEIHAEFPEDGGTCFVVTLPRGGTNESHDARS